MTVSLCLDTFQKGQRHCSKIECVPGVPRGVQSVKHLTVDFHSGHNVTVYEFEPCVELCADSVEPAWDSRSLSLSLSLSLSQNTHKKNPKNVFSTEKLNLGLNRYVCVVCVSILCFAFYVLGCFDTWGPP